MCVRPAAGAPVSTDPSNPAALQVSDAEPDDTSSSALQLSCQPEATTAAFLWTARNQASQAHMCPTWCTPCHVRDNLLHISDISVL